MCFSGVTKAGRQGRQIAVFCGTAKREYLVIPLLRLDDEAIDGVSRPADFEGKTVLFMVRKVIEMNIHQLHKLHEFLIQLGFIVQAHRYRSGLQRYKAARQPTVPLEELRAMARFNAQTPAFEPSPQYAPEIGHISFGL